MVDKTKRKLFLYSALILVFSILLLNFVSADIFQQFGNDVPFSQEKYTGGSDFINGINVSSVNFGIWSETNYNLRQVQPINFVGTNGYYFAFVDSSVLRVYDSSLTLKASTTITGTPIPQILVDSQGYIVVGSYNSTNVIITRYAFDGSSLVISAQNDTIPLNDPTYIPTGLTFDYGNIVFIFDSPLQLGFVDLDTLYFNYSLNVNSNITRYTDGNNINYGVTPLNSFDFNSNGVRDYLIFNDSAIEVFNALGVIQIQQNKSTPSPSNHIPRITDVKYDAVNNQLIVAEAVNPKTSVPTAQGWFNITAFNMSNINQVLWNKKYTVTYSGSNLENPQNIQLALTDIDFNGVIDSVSFILQAGDLNSFQREYNYLGILDLSGNEVYNPYVYNYNVSTSNKNYIPRNILTSGWGDEIGTSYETLDRNFVWSSGGKLLVYSVGQGRLIIGNTTSLSGLTVNPSTLTYTSCVPMNLFTGSDISIVCSSNQSTYLIASKSLFIPTSKSGSGSVGNNGTFIQTVNAVGNLFPDSTTLSTKQKTGYVLISMFVLFFIIMLAFFLATEEVPAIALYSVLILEFVLFSYFVAIKYINIGLVVGAVIVIGGLALLLRRK